MIRPLVLGIDVSRDRMGWGVVDHKTGEAVDCGCIDIAPMLNLKTKADGMDPRRPGRIAAAVTSLPWNSLEDARRDYVVATYLEAPYAGKSGQVTVELALAVGSAWHALAWRYGTVELLAPREWKSLAGVPSDPKDGRKNLKGLALRTAVVEFYAAEGRADMASAVAADKPEKPHAYARAIDLGFRPNGSQDAADAGLIAVAGRRRAGELYALAA